MKPLFLRGLLVSGALAALAGCQQSKEPVLARVGKATITTSDFTSRIRDTPVAYQQYVATPEGRRQFLNLLIREKLLLAEARQAGLPREENYRKAIQQYKERIARQLKDYSESLVIEMYISRLRSKDLAVTDAEIRTYYDAHLEDFTHPVEIQASHILVKTEAEAQSVLDRLKAGESFEKLARSLSMDPATAARGGQLAPFTRGSLMPEFENAVFRLQVGQLSGIVKSSFGYHVIKKTGEKRLAARSLEQAQEEIRNRLQREKFDQWVTREQTAVGVTIDEKALAAVTAAPAASAPGLAQESVQ